MIRRTPLFSRRARSRRSLRSILAVAAVALAVSPARAEAHAVLVKSSPPARASLGHATTRVDLWFNEGIEPAFSSVSVWSTSGARVDRGDVIVGPGDPKRLSVTVEPLAPGAYTVRFRVLSVDGHVAESSFPFTVSPTR